MNIVVINCLLFLLVLSILNCFGNASETVEVTITNGTIIGTAETVDERQVWQFLAIPFAEPPVGNLRWRRPLPIANKWPKPLLGTKPPNGCPQPPLPYNFPTNLLANFSEDCLYLNVWTPSINPERKKSVMVWIHGGAFINGEALPLYHGKVLSSLGDVVVVVIQYRIGFLGFARLDNNLVPGNMGLFDQQLALRWVQENIDHFGGDPDSVTIFGESAGSVSVSLHLFNEESSRYFHRAILQSGTALNHWGCNPSAEAIERLSREIIIKHLNCKETSVEESLQCVLGKSVAEILEAMNKFTAENPLMQLIPVVDGHFLSKHPKQLLTDGKMSKKDLIVGLCEDEGSIAVQFKGVQWLMMNNISGVIDDHFNDKFIDWFLDQMFGYYPYYPQRLSKTLKTVFHMRSLSHVNSNRGDYNAKRMSDLVSELYFDCDTNAFLDAATIIHDNIFFYVLGHKPSASMFPVPPAKWTGASHADDIPFVFGYPLLYPHLEKVMTEEELYLSRRIIEDFTTFAKKGKPRDPNWRPYTMEKKEYYRYAIASTLNNGGRRRDECAVWNHVIKTLIDLSSKCLPTN